MSDAGADARPKRGASRFLAGLPAVLTWEGDDYVCLAGDLSRSGVLLTGNLPSSSGPLVTVSLSSVAGDLRLTAVGQVARVIEDHENGEVRLGVTFDELTDRQRETLESLVARVVEGVSPAALESLPPDAQPRQIREALERIPVAHRASVAARGAVREREIMLHDSDPQVLDALARNPNLTPPEARVLLRARQLLPRTLQHLARDGRWTGSDEFKLHIACHPNAPLAVAERLVEGLSPDGRRRALVQPGLNPTLRMKLGQKARRPGP